MPLSASVDRECMHRRVVDCRGYRRSDGLWDIEGHLTDTKTYPFKNTWRGEVDPGVPVHEMWLRLTVDDELVVHGVEAATDYSPYPECPNFPERFQLLIGMRIASGWTSRIRKELGGVQGCTHLVELLGPVATTAFQTVYPLIQMEQQSSDERIRPPVINTCHALASDGEVVRRQWPVFYTGDKKQA